MTDTATRARSQATVDGIIDALENYHSQTHEIIRLLQLVGDCDEFVRLKGAVDLLHEALMERHNAASALIRESYALRASGQAVGLGPERAGQDGEVAQ